jgi:hypothetical protein
MKTHLKSFGLLGLLLLGLNAGTAQAQLITLTAGAVSTNSGAKLKFVNGTNYAASSGYKVPIIYQQFINRYYTNFYYGTTNLRFQALSVKTNPATAAAAGSYMFCQVMSVTGPTGGVMTFWEQGAKWPTYQFPVNGVYASGKNRFVLGNVQTGAGNPGGDPFGNIPGRRFTFNKFGEYLVTFRLYDASENNPTAAAPIHLPSDTLTVKFVAGLGMEPTSLKQTNNVTTLTFIQSALTNMYVEAATNLTGPWSSVAGPFTNAPVGTGSLLTTLNFTNSPGLPSVFYRLRGIVP